MALDHRITPTFPTVMVCVLVSAVSTDEEPSVFVGVTESIVFVGPSISETVTIPPVSVGSAISETSAEAVVLKASTSLELDCERRS